jgi:hypothetical protein
MYSANPELCYTWSQYLNRGHLRHIKYRRRDSFFGQFCFAFRKDNLTFFSKWSQSKCQINDHTL